MCIEIPINTGDESLENDEIFIVVLTTHGYDIGIGRQTAKVTIIDESVVMIGFVQGNYLTPEEDETGSGAVVEVCVELVSGGGQLERNVVVMLSTAPLSAAGVFNWDIISVSHTELCTITRASTY